MKILAIGNSFSSDATRYLHEISIAGDFPVKIVNLYIGGCSLSTHYKNINNDDKAYMLEFNGYSTGFFVSVREALQSDLWDYVTMQQASHLSVDYETYTPYLQALSKYVSFHAPKAKQVFHRTWAYENDSYRLCTELGYKTHSEMFNDIKTSSERAVREIGIDRIIPSGELIEKLVLEGVTSLYRDDFHLSLGTGRYAAAALWYEYFTGKSITNNSFCKFDESIDNEDMIKINHIIDSMQISKNK